MDTPILILQASKQPYISLGVHFGGIKLQGKEYLYIPPKDAYIRKDHLKEFNKLGWDKFVEKLKNSENV